jgi:cell wall-associated NlpC family hydrolase
MMTTGGRRTLPLLGLAALAALAAGCASAGGAHTPVAFPTARPVVSPAETTPFVAPPWVPEGVVRAALDLTGVAYRFGGEDPSTGVDCSGLVRFVFGQQQLALPRTVAEQYGLGRRVDPGQIQAGDLLFFSTIGPGPTHVGIAIGPSAPGQFVHAPGTGSVVRVERYDTPYWRDRFLAAKRVL